MKKVLIVIPTIETGGGAEKIATSLATSLTELGKYDVTLLTFYDRPEEYTFFGKRISLKENYAQNKLSKLFKRSLEIKRACRNMEIDTTISFIEEANLPLVLSRLLGNNSKTLISIRNNPLAHRNIFYKIFIFLFYRFAEKIIANSREAKTILEEKFRFSNITSIYNHHDIGKYKSLSAENIESRADDFFRGDELIFLNIGRFTEQKGHIHLINSFQMLLENNKNAKLVILGEGEKKQKIQNAIMEKKLSDKVLVLNRTKNILPIMKRSDCFVLSSKREGLPNVLIEALACNTPIISADCKTGPREILSPGTSFDKKLQYPFLAKYGILVSPFDNSDENNAAAEKILADAMARMTDQRVRQYYQNGIERAKDFDSEKIMEQWERMI